MGSPPTEDGLDAEPLFYAQCRARSTTMQVPVHDISITGCLIGHRGMNVRAGERVLIKPPGLGLLASTVLWISEDSAGLEFDHALYEPVLAHLLKNLSD